MNSKYEHIKFIIQRFDHFYDTVNNKGAFYIGLNTFIFGGICIGYTSLHKEVEVNNWIWACLIALLLSCIASALFTIAAIHPYRTDNHGNNASPSLMFFGGISKHTFSNLKQKIDAQTDEQMTEEALCQMHTLAKGLSGKFKKLGIAGILLWVQFLIMAPLFFLIIKNLK